jgi:putative flippase GtrA
VKRLGLRWLKFNLVGTLGFAVQLGCLKLLLHFQMNYLAATALAVEIAVLHNFVWHERFTWKDRPGGAASASCASCVFTSAMEPSRFWGISG